MTREEFYKLTDILNSEVLGNFMHGDEADELIAMFEEAVERSNILEQEEPIIPDIVDEHYWEMLGEEPQEHVNNDFEKALTEMIDKAQKCVVEPWAIAAQWKDYLIELAKSEEPISEEWIKELRTKLDSMSKEDFKKVFDKYAVDFNEEPVSKELEEAAYHNCIDRLSKESIEDFKAGAKWQKLQDMGITNNRAQDVVANVLSSADNPLDAYATEVAFMMIPATLKESYHQTNRDRIGDAVKLGAKWKENHLWKPADGDDLPEIDKEVIALFNNGKVVFAHRPYKGKYIGKNLTTGNIETFENKTYDKGGWNIPNVKYWLDVEFPKETEL